MKNFLGAVAYGVCVVGAFAAIIATGYLLVSGPGCAAVIAARDWVSIGSVDTDRLFDRCRP